MPEFIPVANVAQCDIRGLLWGQQVQNTLYFSHVGGAITDENMEDLVNQVNTRWTTYFKPKLPRAYTFLEVYGIDLTSATAASATSQQGGGWNGAYPTDSTTMPGALTFCISFRSNGRGKNQRGRNYWPGLPRSVCNGNQVLVDYAFDLTVAYNTLLPGGVSPVAGWQWVIVSRFTNKAPRPTGAIIPVTESTFVDLNIDCQRRRLHGRGN